MFFCLCNQLRIIMQKFIFLAPSLFFYSLFPPLSYSFCWSENFHFFHCCYRIIFWLKSQINFSWIKKKCLHYDVTITVITIAFSNHKWVWLLWSFLCYCFVPLSPPFVIFLLNSYAQVLSTCFVSFLNIFSCSLFNLRS